MASRETILVRILSGSADANVAFNDLCKLVRALGFDERIKGSHHIFSKDAIPEILNLQSKRGKAKPYQVKQVRELIVKHQLAGESDEE